MIEYWTASGGPLIQRHNTICNGIILYGNYGMVQTYHNAYDEKLLRLVFRDR